jgi:F-type H+-transporting ATPase subunit a
MDRFIKKLVMVASALAAPSYAAEAIPHTINYYEMIADALHVGRQWIPTIGGVFVLLLLTAMGLKYKAEVARAGDQVVPGPKFSLRFLIESIFDFAYQLTKDNCGHIFRKFLPLMCGIFVFILVANLTGLVPGFPPPTMSMDTNVAIGLIVLVVYNYAGFKEHGGAYMKHFVGPVVWIAPLFFVIELISHGARPLSLGFRLMGNLYGDHTVVGVFTGLTYVVFPALLMFLGLLVAVVQSFVFTLLTGIYISMAISHDH